MLCVCVILAVHIIFKMLILVCISWWLKTWSLRHWLGKIKISKKLQFFFLNWWEPDIQCCVLFGHIWISTVFHSGTLIALWEIYDVTQMWLLNLQRYPFLILMIIINCIHDGMYVCLYACMCVRSWWLLSISKNVRHAAILVCRMSVC